MKNKLLNGQHLTLNDMFTLRVRPNKVLVNQAIYKEKAMTWKEHWPMLTVENWQ